MRLGDDVGIPSVFHLLESVQSLHVLVRDDEVEVDVVVDVFFGTRFWDNGDILLEGPTEEDLE